MEELQTVRQDLQLNGYPKHLLDRCQQSLYAPRAQPLSDQQDAIKVSAPYIKGTTEKVKRLLRKHNVTVFDTNRKSLRNKLCHLKDKRKTLEKKQHRV